MATIQECQAIYDRMEPEYIEEQPTYTVMYTVVTRVPMEIQADSPEDAKQQAHDLLFDMGDEEYMQLLLENTDNESMEVVCL